MNKDDYYRVEVRSYVGEPRRVVVWQRYGEGPWYLWGSLAVPEDVDADVLTKEVRKRLPEPVARAVVGRVYLKLAAGLGR